MSQVVTYVADDGTLVGFEIEPLEGFVPAGVEDIAGRVKSAIGPAVTAAQAVLDRVRMMGPGAVEVKFGVKVTGTANWLVAKAATEGNFEVTLSWSPNRQDGSRRASEAEGLLSPAGPADLA